MEMPPGHKRTADRGNGSGDDQPKKKRKRYKKKKNRDDGATAAVATAAVAAAAVAAVAAAVAPPDGQISAAAPATSPASKKAGRGSAHPFEADYGDHFETPLVAYQHLAPVLEAIARGLGRTRASLRIYDPFFCEGAMITRLASLGFKTVLHENVDFYSRVSQGGVPDHDVLVTNPPYSGDHKERILRFCARSGKPWALLMPNYVATKQYYSDIVGGTSGGGGDRQSSGGDEEPFFIAPRDAKYQYTHPEGTGHADSPFDSIWFVRAAGFISNPASSPAASGSSKPKKDPGNRANSARLPLHRLKLDGCSAVASTAELRRLGLVPQLKRMNPRQRRAAAKRKNGGANLAQGPG